jgi:hypothetical protein
MLVFGFRPSFEVVKKGQMFLTENGVGIIPPLQGHHLKKID